MKNKLQEFSELYSSVMAKPIPKHESKKKDLKTMKFLITKPAITVCKEKCTCMLMIVHCTMRERISKRLWIT